MLFSVRGPAWGIISRAFWTGLVWHCLALDTFSQTRLAGVWEQQSGYIILVVTIILLQTMLIVSIVFNRVRRRKVELAHTEIQASVAAEHRRLEEILANTPGAVWEAAIDPKTGERRLTFISDYIEKMLGYSVDEWLSNPELGFSIIVEEDRELVAREIDSVIDTGQPKTVEFRWLAKDGTQRWVELTVLPIHDPIGNTTGLRGVYLDITDRKHAEETARERETRLQGIAESTTALIWVADENAKITFVNQICLEFTGRTKEDLLGTGWLDGVHEEDAQRCVDIYTAAYLTREPFVYEYRIRHADGTFHWLYSTSAPRFSPIGEFLGYAGSCIDITDRKLIEESLKTALQEIRVLKDNLHEENIQLKEMIKLEHDFDEMVGNSNALKYVLFKIEQVAPTDTSVLITGETGTGKELVARAIHSTSSRKNQPLVKVNCAALSASLIESELFGHERGAFTGATARKIGRFELADGGTIFLDEIGELPLDLQPKLLRVIQEGEFERLGSAKTLKANVRIIAATNRELHEAVRSGRFREDLLYRLNVYPITVPPLRKRADDIPLLVEYFAGVLSKKIGKTITSVAPATMRTLVQHRWPGNVRELANVIERAVIGSSDEQLRVLEQFEASTLLESSNGSIAPLENIERDHILKALTTTAGRIEGPKGAAHLLGLHPSTLRTRMNKLGLSKSRSPR